MNERERRDSSDARGGEGTRAESILLGMLLLFGGAFLVVTPPFQVPDEPSHFFRAYALSEGDVRIRTYGGVASQPLPESLLEIATDLTERVSGDEREILTTDQIRQAWSKKLERQRRAHARVPLVSSGPVRYTSFHYLPTLFVPSAFGILIGRAAGLPALGLLYAARAANLLLAAALLYLTVRRLSSGRFLFSAAALVPMGLHLTASASPDGLLLAAAIALTALLAEASWGSGGVTRPAAILMLVLLFVIVSHKAFYGPMLFLLWVIPLRRFSTRRNGWLFRALAAAVAVLAALSAFAWSFAPYPAAADPESSLRRWEASPADPARDPVGVMDPGGHARRIAAAPLSFFVRTGAQLVREAPVKLYEMTGRFGVRLDAPYPYTARALCIILLLALALFSTSPGSLITWPQRFWLAAAISCSVLAIATVMYLVSTPVGVEDIKGIQGRYFLPLLAAGLAMLPNVRSSGMMPDRISRRLLTIVPAFYLLIALWAIAARYYGVYSPFRLLFLQ